MSTHVNGQQRWHTAQFDARACRVKAAATQAQAARAQKRTQRARAQEGRGARRDLGHLLREG
eukprot:861176-Rhodomonas_salina.1